MCFLGARGLGGLLEVVGVAKKFGSLYARPRKESVTGRPLLVMPAGTMMSGEPLSSAKITADSPAAPPRFALRTLGGCGRGLDEKGRPTRGRVDDGVELVLREKRLEAGFQGRDALLFCRQVHGIIEIEGDGGAVFEADELFGAAVAGFRVAGFGDEFVERPGISGLEGLQIVGDQGLNSELRIK